MKKQSALRLVDTRTMDREQWLEVRKGGIGSSDAAAAVGLCPYKSQLELWMEKTGRTPTEAAPPGMDDPRYWGMRLACARVERPRRVHQYEADVPAASAPPDRLAQPRRGGRYQPPWLTEDTPEAGGMAQAGNHRIAALHAADELWPTERKQVCVLHGEPGMGPFQRQARARPHYRHDVMSAFEQELHHAAPGSTAGTDDQNPHRLVAGAEWGAVGWQGIEGRRAGRGVRVAGMLRLASGRAQSAGDQAHPERDGRRSRRGLAVTVGTTRSACACQGARGGPRHGPADAAGPAAHGLTWASARCRSRAPRRWTA